MNATTPRRRLALSAAAAVAGGMVFAGVPAAHAAVNGNIETSNALYYCEDGDQKAVVYARALNTAEEIDWSAGSGGSGTLPESVPNESYGLVYTTGDAGGLSATLTFKGVKSGDSLSVNLNVPSSCTGLPTSRPESGWDGQVQDPSATSTSPTSSSPTSSSPTSSSPTSSSPTSSSPTSSEPTSSEPTSSEPTSSEPTSSEPTSSETTSTATDTEGPTGPPVQTDQLGGGDDTAVLALVGLVAAGAVVTGGAAARLRRSR
ncbi:hypothetical protein ACMYYO_05115 [Dermacoccaceae bacterium W4C1]